MGAESVHRPIGRELRKQRLNAYVLEDDARLHNSMISAGAIMPLHLLHKSGETRTGDCNRSLANMRKNDAEEHAGVALLLQPGMSHRNH